LIKLTFSFTRLSKVSTSISIDPFSDILLALPEPVSNRRVSFWLERPLDIKFTFLKFSKFFFASSKLSLSGSKI
jgi:hypothetical protein